MGNDLGQGHAVERDAAKGQRCEEREKNKYIYWSVTIYAAVAVVMLNDVENGVESENYDEDYHFQVLHDLRGAKTALVWPSLFEGQMLFGGEGRSSLIYAVNVQLRVYSAITRHHLADSRQTYLLGVIHYGLG